MGKILRADSIKKPIINKGSRKLYYLIGGNMPVEGIDPYSPPIPAQVNPEPPVEEQSPEVQESVQEEDVGNNIDTSA